MDDGEVRDKLQRARFSLGLDYPHVVEMRFAERSFERLLDDAREGAFAEGNPEALLRLYEELLRLQVSLNNGRNSPASSEAKAMLDALAEALEAETRNSGLSAINGNGGSPFSGIQN